MAHTSNKTTSPAASSRKGKAMTSAHAHHAASAHAPPPGFPGQVVLVLQGGGALGAYQLGVIQALLQSGIEPNWVIGTSIGAINAALLAGNPPETRLQRLEEFWHRVEQQPAAPSGFDWLGLSRVAANLSTVTRGIPSFFAPNPVAWRGVDAQVGVEAAAYYSTSPLYEILA